MQKEESTKASLSKVNPSTLSPNELIHSVDVSVASKYGADLAQLTQALAEDVWSTLDLFWQDMDDNLPCQI
jgi:hypothetical protein